MIENYIDYITYVRQYSNATILNYKKWLRKLDDYLISIWKNIDDPESIKLVDIYNLMEDMSKSWLQARTCAGHIYGSNIYAVAKILGHKRITTTQIYLGTDNMELKNLQFWLRFN